MASKNKRGRGRIVALTRYFFRCPPAKHVLILMLVSALLFPVAGSDVFSRAGFFVFLFVPALLTAIFGWKVVVKMGGAIKDRHTYFLSTVSMILIAGLLAIVSIIEKFYIFRTWNTIEILFVGLAAVFMLHLLVFAAVGGISIYRSLVPGSIYLVFSAIILYATHTVTLKILSRFAALVFVSFIIVWLFAKLSDVPFKRTFGISTFDLISLAIMEFVDAGQITKNPFEKIGKEVRIPYQALQLDAGREKYLVTVPWVHPGPIQGIGGKLPGRLINKLKERFTNATFLHTYVDNTLNPIFPDRLVETISTLHARAELSNGLKATKFIKIKKGAASIIAQKLGKNYFVVSSFAPDMTEDISPGVGLTILEKFNNRIFLIDAHNSFSEGDAEAANVYYGDSRATALVSAIYLAKKRLDREKQHQIKFAMLSSKKDHSAFGINGINFLAFEINMQKIALVVLNTNNIVPAFRGRINSMLKKEGFDISEVLTTDAHLGDYAIKFFGRTGKIGSGVLQEDIRNLAKASFSALVPVKARYLFTGINSRVFGEKAHHQLVATIHAMIPFAKFLSVTLFIAFLLAAQVILNL